MKMVSAIRAPALALAAFASACGPTKSIPHVPSRSVPYPLERSGADIADDSLVRRDWTCRGDVPDPLADAETGPRLLIAATLYGEDMIAAEIADSCAVDSLRADSCARALRGAYDARHDPREHFRIRLDLESTFSVNSLHHKFWDMYIKDEQDIMYEPVRIAMEEPQIVRRDSLPEPGRAPVRAGMYRRTVNLYFPIRTPFGAETLSPTVPEIKLIISQKQRELSTFVWHIAHDGEQGASTRSVRRRGGGDPDF